DGEEEPREEARGAERSRSKGGSPEGQPEGARGPCREGRQEEGARSRPSSREEEEPKSVEPMSEREVGARRLTRRPVRPRVASGVLRSLDVPVAQTPGRGPARRSDARASARARLAAPRRRWARL